MSASRVRRIHFVGIGGTGMSGLAEVVLRMEYEVSGSDMAQTDVVERLAGLGARIWIGHNARNVKDADLVVVSSAIGRGNPEVRAARRRGVPTLRRGEMLAEIMRLHHGIAIAGSHGKTTTTSLVGHLLAKAGMDPTVIVGGRLKMIGSHARLGSGRTLVAEADESDGSFLDLSPSIAVVTNIDREHLDHYRDLPDVQRSFLKFMKRVPFYGLAVVCGDDPNVRSLLPRMRKRVLTYGFGPDNQLRALEPRTDGLKTSFVVEWQGVSLGTMRLNIPGRHNIENALAAVAVGLEVGVPASRCLESLDDFPGVARRFEIRGETDGVLWVDDYGHHPTEIDAVLSTARAAFDRRLLVVFQPHRFTRTRALAREFAEALRKADEVVLADIYPAGERPIPGVTSDVILDAMRVSGDPCVSRVRDFGEAVEVAASRLRSGDVLITLGAGSVTRWGAAILQRRAQHPDATTDGPGGGSGHDSGDGSDTGSGDEVGSESATDAAGNARNGSWARLKAADSANGAGRGPAARGAGHA